MMNFFDDFLHPLNFFDDFLHKSVIFFYLNFFFFLNTHEVLVCALAYTREFFFLITNLKIDKPGNLRIELDLWIPAYNLALEYQGKFSKIGKFTRFLEFISPLFPCFF